MHAGACGGVLNALGKGNIASPNSPDPYPGNISCMWTITGISTGQVQLNVTFVSLEAPSDTLKVCSQPSCSGSGLLATLTGNLHYILYTLTFEPQLMPPSVCRGPGHHQQFLYCTKQRIFSLDVTADQFSKQWEQTRIEGLFYHQ